MEKLWGKFENQIWKFLNQFRFRPSLNDSLLYTSDVYVIRNCQLFKQLSIEDVQAWNEFKLWDWIISWNQIIIENIPNAKWIMQ